MLLHRYQGHHLRFPSSLSNLAFAETSHPGSSGRVTRMPHNAMERDWTGTYLEKSQVHLCTIQVPGSNWASESQCLS